MLIYRVETREGLGPWCDANGDWDKGAGTAWCGNAHGLHHKAGEWLEETKSCGERWRFGFMSLDQLLFYMHGCDADTMGDYDRTRLHERFETMERQKLVVSVYRLTRKYNSLLGDATQCIFNRDMAQLVTHLEPRGKYLRDYVDNFGKPTDQFAT